MITRLEDFKVYNLAMELGEDVWDIVNVWDYFAKKTVGIQLVQATDSIAANLSEGLGRFHFKDAKNFSYFSRGSLFETKTWLTKAVKRNLLTEEKYFKLIGLVESIGRMLNAYINSIGTVKEPVEPYGVNKIDFPDSDNA